MKGIMFIEYLYLKTINGFKTMTRRSGGLNMDFINEDPDQWEVHAYGIGLCTPEDSYKSIISYFETNKSKYDNTVEVVMLNRSMNKFVTLKPRYKYNEVVFLKEPTCEKEGAIYYKYDGYGEPESLSLSWGNKMFMPTDHARVFVRVISVRLQRLHNISDDDCIAEGVTPIRFRGGKKMAKLLGPPELPNNISSAFVSLKDAFFNIYKFANKAKTVPNDWVWVYGFELLKDYKNERRAGKLTKVEIRDNHKVEES